MAKRGQGEGTITKRADGRWCGRLTIGKDDEGKQKRKAIYGKTMKEVKVKMDEYKGQINKGKYIEPSNMTVGEWMDIWLKEYKKHEVKLTTYLMFHQCSNNHIIPSLGKIKLKDLKNVEIQQFVNNLIDKGYASSSISRISSVLISCLNKAQDLELILKNPAQKVTLPKISFRKKKVLTIDEQKMFIYEARESFFGKIFILILGTGLRIGEALALTWEDIDFENEILDVNKAQREVRDPDNPADKYFISVDTPKTKSSIRKIPLLPDIVMMLKEIKDGQEFIKESNPNYNLNNNIFCNRIGKPNWKTTCKNVMKRTCNKIGVDGVSIHDLRHTFATRGLENGIELKVMQELLGHSSIKMTADLYTHVLPEKKKDSIMKLLDTINLTKES